MNNKEQELLQTFDAITGKGFNLPIVKHPEFIQKIDWKLLREQKLHLLNVISSEEGTKCIPFLEGLVNLLDALQDYAADDMGLGDKLVFNLDKDGTKPDK